VSLPAGNYTVSAADVNLCNQVASFTITAPAAAVTVTETHQDATCSGNSNGFIILSANGGVGGYTYSWSPNVSTTGSALDIPAGNYSVTVADANSCTIDITVSVLQPPALSFTSASSDALCKGDNNGSITVTGVDGTPPYSYTLLLNGANVSSTTGIFNDLKAGSYNYTVTDANGCETTGSGNVQEPDSVLVYVSPATAEVVLEETTLQLLATSNQSGAVSYEWSPESGLSCYDCSDPEFIGDVSQSYLVKVKATPNGCEGTATVEVTVLPKKNVFIPNAFTPDGDGINDEWQIFGLSDIAQSVEAKIFNRWGEVIFETHDLAGKWDGTYHGKNVEPGVYVYWVSVSWRINRKDSHFKGSVTVLR
jgi:gliding motility-associated-like protein